MRGHGFVIVPGIWAVARLDAGSPVPEWAMSGRFCSVTRTEAELSIVCPQESVPPQARREDGWALIEVRGPFPFSATGILSSFAEPLAAAGVSIVALSTFDTDYFLVKMDEVERAAAVLCEAGHIRVQTRTAAAGGLPGQREGQR